METFDTNKGKLTENDLLDELGYCSYAANRRCGMTHEILAGIGLGKKEWKERFEKENIKTTEQ